MLGLTSLLVDIQIHYFFMMKIILGQAFPTLKSFIRACSVYYFLLRSPIGKLRCQASLRAKSDSQAYCFALHTTYIPGCAYVTFCSLWALWSWDIAVWWPICQIKYLHNLSIPNDKIIKKNILKALKPKFLNNSTECELRARPPLYYLTMSC